MAVGGRDHNSCVTNVMSTSLSSGRSGENVNQTFEISPVGVVTGNHNNGNKAGNGKKIVFNITSAAGEASPSNQAIVIGRDPNEPPPTAATKQYNAIVLALQSVENIRHRKQILSTVHKLKALAYRGMRVGKVAFEKTDLTKFGVSPEELQDLLTKVPGNNLPSQHSMQGDFTFVFGPQSLQEYLAAIFITEMGLGDFSRFDEKLLHKDRWFVVRQFVAGVLFSKPRNDLYRGRNGEVKQQIFSRSIRFQLEKCSGYLNRHIRMELYRTIYESDDDNLMRELSVIDVSDIPLSGDEAHIVGSLAARNKSLDTLNLRSCRIDDWLLDIITRCLRNRIHVTEVNLHHNHLSATALRSLLGHRRIESVYGNLDWEVVKLGSEWRLPLELKNEEDVIKISDGAEGHFTRKDSTLSFKVVLSVEVVDFIGKLFESDVKLIEELYVKPSILWNISGFKLEKISKILLDCTEEDVIEWSRIENYSKKYQLDYLQIAVNGQIDLDKYNRILDGGRAMSVFGNIHAMFHIATEEEFWKVIEACKQKKIEYIRCIFNDGARAPLHEISSLVNNSDLKKVTFLYSRITDMLKGGELTKAQQIANDSGTELKVLTCEPIKMPILKMYRLESDNSNSERTCRPTSDFAPVHLHEDVWMRLDFKFLGRDLRKRMQEKFPHYRHKVASDFLQDIFKL